MVSLRPRMPRLVIILLLSCAYIGCAVSPTARVGRPDPAREEPWERPRPGGTLRVLVGSGLSRAGLVRSCVARPVTESALAAPVLPPGPGPFETAAPERYCRLFEIEATGGRAEGTVRPDELITAWERGLRDSAAPHRWLLEPVLGAGSFAVGLARRVEGLRVAEGGLEVCTSRPAPDLSSRLSHPALWFPQPARAVDFAHGPGPFRLGRDGLLQPAPRPAGVAPYLEQVEAVDDQGTPALLLRLAEADLGLLLGADAGELLDPTGGPLRLERIERWDRVYYLWLDPGRRWVNDPRFRRWVGSVIDREAMLEYLFDGRGEPAAGLLAGETAGPAPTVTLPRPLSADSRPRLDLCFDEGDPFAASIAARARAELELHGVELALDPRDASGLSDALSRGRASMMLLAHRPGLEDPVLALTESLIRLPGVPVELLESLRAGSRSDDPRERLANARNAEAGVLRDGRLLPLVRLHAWMALDPALRDVRTGSDGLLILEQVWWAR